MLTGDAKAKAEAIKQEADQQSQQLVEQAKNIKNDTISGANDLTEQAKAKTAEIKQSMDNKVQDAQNQADAATTPAEPQPAPATNP
ncbi:Uncharacterised protein [Serratia odorifera]|uniref:Uncharacterized protein n=1 Tax=Serratia odorifera TaxID=618 RepID=A0A447KTW7_SEROD|nr:Uncharacterised protein [Serratia odorifera]